jgi:phosphoglycolate phosphatase-like HAD superfamily hydrolase
MNDHPGSLADLDSILTHARFLLFDFDGTICSLFAGTPTDPIGDQLRALISTDHTELPGTRDWFKILAHAHSLSPALGAQVAGKLTEIETAAVPTARPTAYVHDAIAACRESGRGVAIISNNSDQAVRAYLDRHDLARLIPVIAARTDPNPAKLKPSPYLIEQAAEALGTHPAACAMVGDSRTDMQSARSASTLAIGYTPAMANAERLIDAGAQTVVSSMADLALRLRARPLPN